MHARITSKILEEIPERILGELSEAMAWTILGGIPEENRELVLK